MPMGEGFWEGTVPARRVRAFFLPTCPREKYQCSWGFSFTFRAAGYNDEGFFWLKYINTSCPEHNKLETTRMKRINRSAKYVPTPEERRRQHLYQ